MPLNKDLRNHGLILSYPTGSGELVDDNMFGKVWHTSGSGSIDTKIPISEWNTNSGSVAFGGWIKVNLNELKSVSAYSYTSTYGRMECSTIGASYYGGYGLNLLTNSIYTDGKVVSARMGAYLRHSSTTIQALFPNNVIFDEWHHYFTQFDFNKKTVYSYYDGEFVSSGSNVNLPQTALTRNFFINLGACWGGNANARSMPFYVHDVRLYNNLLSEHSIKELANSKVFEIHGGLHLKATTNLMADKDYSVSNLTTNCTTQNDADGGKYVMTTTRIGSYTSDSIRLQFPSTVGFTDGKDYSISYDYKVGAGSGNLHQGLDVNDGTPVVKVTDKESGMKRVEVIVESGTPRYSYNTYRFIDFNKIAQNSKYKIWRMQVEEGKTPTPYTPSHRDERYVDLSGFDNEVIPYNITQSGSSFYFNGVDSAIQIPLHKMISGGTYSINLWFYRPNGEFSSKGYESFFGGPSGFELDSKNGTGTTPCVYIISAFGSGSKTYECNKWNMVTMTRTPSESKFYLNGVLFKTGSAGTTPAGNYFIGAWVSRTQQNFKGYIKNFSVFNKQLSDNDVMNLYIHGE